MATYSLWMKPKGNVAYKLQERIKKLSKKHDTPSFSPHVTLLGGIKTSKTEAVSFADTLAASAQPFELKLTKTGYRDRFYQSLYVHVENNPQLQELRKTALELFDITDPEEYMPHLSLLYGNLSQEQKERILNREGREFYISFRAKNLVLMQTDGKPDQWKRIHSAPFGGHS